MITIPIVGPVMRLLCRRINNGPEFVKNCKSDMAKETLHLRNPDDFALSMELGISVTVSGLL